jgi:hypothetical protein
MLRRLCTITQSGKAPIVTAAGKKASCRDCGWECFSFQLQPSQPDAGQRQTSRARHGAFPRMNIPHQWLLPESSTARPFAVDPFKNRDQPGSCVAALLKIAPVVNQISRRAIHFRPVQEAESRRCQSTPLAEPRSQYSRESIFQVYRGFFDGRELDCDFDFAGSILQALLWPLP